VVARIEDILKKCNVYGATFSEVGEHTPEAGIENGVSRLREVDADILVSVGRGSPPPPPIDASNAIIFRLQEQMFKKSLTKSPGSCDTSPYRQL
jgi:alcohol dehydrogenase class IV